MIRFRTALNTILRFVDVLGWEYLPMPEALNRVSEEDIYSDQNIPGFDNSAMDGFALRSTDTAGTARRSANIFEVIDNIRAGDFSRKTLKSGQAIRIMTGATIPRGADSVVMVERTEKVKATSKELIKVYGTVKSGENIREVGQDIKKGERVIAKGTLLSSAHIGILASLGKRKVKVVRKPRVGILATGSELVEAGDKLKPGMIRNSNAYALYCQAVNAGCIPQNLGIAKDDFGELEQKIRRGLKCDILLTSGGVSVGEYDFVKSVLSKVGADIKFWRVAIKPGKPLVFAKVDKTLIFGLPGNPVSSMVGFEIFVKPAILKMSGRGVNFRQEVSATLVEDIIKIKGLMFFLRAQTQWKNGAYVTKTTGPQGSAILKSMALANSLIILPEGQEKAIKGEQVLVRFFD